MKDVMCVVGKTTTKEVYVASVTRRFITDEYLKIEDEINGNPIGEVVEIFSYSKVKENTFPSETGIYQSLQDLGLLHENKTVHMAKVNILEELQYAVTPHSTVTIPNFSEIEDLLVSASPEKGFVLGVIRGTEKFQPLLPDSLRNLVLLYKEKSGIVPQEGVPFIFPFYKLNEYPHFGFFGGTGSGKTHALRVVCEEIMRHGIPGVVIDPHFELRFDRVMEGLPEEHRADFSHRFELFQVGENVGINFTELTTGELISLMEFVGEVTMPMRGAIEALHKKNDTFAKLHDRITNLKKAFENMDLPKREQENLPEDVVLLYERYKDKVSGTSTLQAVSWRLDQLNRTGIFNHDVSKVEACLLKCKLAVIRGEVSLLKMLTSYLVRKMYGKRRAYCDWKQKKHGDDKYAPPKFPPFFIILDEAHIFAPNGEQRINPTKAILREISQEARKYGVYEILGTQRPAALDTTIVSQLNTKVIFRTQNESDMRMIQTETDLDSRQVSRLPRLPSGNAFISSATLKKTFYIRFRATKTVSPHSHHPFDELGDFNENRKLAKILKNFLPISTDSIQEKQSEISKAAGKMISRKEIVEALDEMVRMKEARQEDCKPFGIRYLPV